MSTSATCRHCGLPIAWWFPSHRPHLGFWRHVETGAERCTLIAGPGQLGAIARLAEARALLDAWCTAAEDGEPLGPLRAQTLGWLG